MSVFSSINQSLPPKEQLVARQQALINIRSTADNPPILKGSFFKPLLFDQVTVSQKNCENLVGQVSLPVGIVGPLSATLITDKAKNELENILIPLATTEGALVASINRGCKLLNSLNDLKVVINNVGMTRAPVFECHDNSKAKDLISWIKSKLPQLGLIGESTSSHLHYLSCQIWQKKNLVFARFAFDTGDAMGMNMVTLATSAIADYIVAHNPGVSCPAISSNVCTDKKTSSLTRHLGRGRSVTVTCTISEKILDSILKTNPKDLLATYHAKIVVGSRLAGLAGHNMHIANAAAAILTATGQDIAHTVDISQGILTLNKNNSGISVKLSLPSVPVGTVGGGTWLDAQTTARNLISNKPVTSDILAATIGLGALAGELSGLAALASNTLAPSHERLARI